LSLRIELSKSARADSRAVQKLSAGSSLTQVPLMAA
jgi:hypothetical protein